MKKKLLLMLMVGSIILPSVVFWGNPKHEVVAEKNGLGIILDKNSNSSVLFLDKFYDYTEKVLAILRTKKDDKEEKKENSQKKKK